MYTYIYIYIYIERERDRYRYIYIYIYCLFIVFRGGRHLLTFPAGCSWLFLSLRELVVKKQYVDHSFPGNNAVRYVP